MGEKSRARAARMQRRSITLAAISALIAGDRYLLANHPSEGSRATHSRRAHPYDLDLVDLRRADAALVDEVRTQRCEVAGLETQLPKRRLSRGLLSRRKAMLRLSEYLAVVLFAILLPQDIVAADYADGLAPPGAPASAFPAPGRPVARIVTDIWRDEETRDRAGEAERVMNLLGVTAGLDVADIGAGSGYYTVRLARRVGPTGHVFAEDIVPPYLERLARRVANEGLASTVTVVRGDPHDPRLPAGSVDLALLAHMYHEVQQPYGLLWNLRPALRPDARVAVIDARWQTEIHGTPPDLLRCELAAVGFRQTGFYDLQDKTYLAVFEPLKPPDVPASPAAIRPCVPGRG
jgi:SAM-dependent methyltransferase